MSSTTSVLRGQSYRKRRSGVIRQVAGFTTKPTALDPSDGIRRARLITPGSTRETRVRVDQLFKSYESVA